MSIYLKIPGLIGHVTEKHHQNWIALDHCYYRVTDPMPMKVGSNSNRIGGMPIFSHLEVRWV